jgi:hypothetical protein
MQKGTMLSINTDASGVILLNMKAVWSTHAHLYCVCRNLVIEIACGIDVSASANRYMPEKSA